MIPIAASDKPNPLISVIMCTYNGAKYLRCQLDSILSQSLNDFELIVLDDVSSDQTHDILLEYARENDCMKVVRNEKNLGFNKNFEKGMLLAKGKYIACSDQDDIWYPNKLERLIGAIGDHAVVFSNSVYIDQMGKTIKFVDESGIERDHCLLRDFSLDTDYRGLLLGNFVTGHTMLINTTFLANVLPLPENGYYDWWIGFIALFQNKLYYLDEVLTQYRKHPESVINTELRSDPLHLIIYKSSRHHFAHFYHDIDGIKESWLIQSLKALYGPPLTRFQYIYIFFLLNIHYNKLFPLMRRRKPLSKTKFRLINEFLKDTELAKTLVFKTKKPTEYGIDYYCFN